MQESNFLTRLYEIKPFKIVQSPQHTKSQSQHHQQPQSTQLIQPPILTPTSMHPPFTNSYQLSKSTIPVPGKPQPLTALTPQKSYDRHQPQSSKNSSDRKNQKFANQVEASPSHLGRIRKSYSLFESDNAVCRTPNKENEVHHPASVIEPHLYNNISSSIDTLFSKIQRIKQEFDCPASSSKKNQNSGSQSKVKNGSIKSKQISSDLNKSTGKSPILQKNNIELNQFPSLNLSCLHRHDNMVLKKYSNSKPKAAEKADTQTKPFIEASQNNFTEINRKTKSIIEEINQLLDSSKKNYQPLERSSRKENKGAKCDTYQEQVSSVSISSFQAKHQELDELDSQFNMIKLKFTQSENFQPALGVKRVLKESGKFQYKLDQPLHHQQQNTRHLKSQYSPTSSLIIQALPTPPIDKQAGPLSMREFELGRCVGSGKFGDVHICKHKPTGFLFAIKKIFKSTLIEYNMIEQFTRQLRIHYSLSNHPHITKLYTHFSDQYHIFLVLQYIQGGTMLPLQPIPQPTLSPLIDQLLTTIQYLHRNSIIHRDIKPENILLSNGVIKLCDFGWSSRCENQMRRTFCGTLDYVSPEMKDRGQYDEKVDLWSVGVLVFQMLAGFPPYKKEIEKWRVMGANIKSKWNWDVLYPPQFSQDSKNFIQKLLKENPKQRTNIRSCKQEQFITKYNPQKEHNPQISTQIQNILLL